MGQYDNAIDKLRRMAKQLGDEVSDCYTQVGEKYNAAKSARIREKLLNLKK